MARRPVVPTVPSVVVALVVALLAVVVVPAEPAGAAQPVEVRYHRPTGAVLVEPFDPPAQPWMAGNRGADYGTRPGDAVTAAAAGEVVFAGDVAGALHVTVRHADGLRTSYSFLAEISVRAGQRVVAHQPIGVAGGPVHVGVRTPDGTYLDPEALFAGRLAPRVTLVPSAQDGVDPLAERRSLLQVVLDRGREVVGELTAEGVDLLEVAALYAVEMTPTTHVLRAVDAGVTWVRQRLDCTDADEPVPASAGRRIAVVVSGLGTDSGGNSAWRLDTDALGYDDADVVRFSYRGGRAPGPDGAAVDPSLRGIPVREFSKLDSQQSLEVSADRLAELLEDIGRARPGMPIDVLAHSQGGVVARLGVVAAGADGRLPGTVENLVTLGSPHQGAPLATTALAAQAGGTGRDVLATVRLSGLFDDLDERHPAIGQLAETSDVLAAMRALPVPDGVRFTSIGAAGDVVVPGTATADRQADTHLIVPSSVGQAAHGELTERADVTREVALAVRGLPPTCQPFGDAALAFAEAEGVRFVEHGAGAVLVGGFVTGDVALGGASVVTAPLEDDAG